jgi:hypothetical protein
LAYLEGKTNVGDVPEGVGDRIVRESSRLSCEAESPETTFRSFDPKCNVYEDLSFRVACYGKRQSE